MNPIGDLCELISSQFEIFEEDALEHFTIISDDIDPEFAFQDPRWPFIGYGDYRNGSQILKEWKEARKELHQNSKAPKKVKPTLIIEGKPVLKRGGYHYFRSQTGHYYLERKESDRKRILEAMQRVGYVDLGSTYHYVNGRRQVIIEMLTHLLNPKRFWLRTLIP